MTPAGAALERIERLFAALERALAGPARAALTSRLLATTGLSREGIEWALERCLERRASQDERSRLAASVVRAPRAHVILPASVFVAAHRALALGLCAAPRVCVKPSRRDPALIEALHAQDPELFQLVSRLEPEAGDHVFAYGSDVTLEALRRELPPGSVLHGHGSGFGVAVVDLDAASALGAQELASIAAAIAEDTACFDQRGCLSPRFVLALGAARQVEPFAARLAAALGQLEQRLPLGRLDADERAEITWYRQCAACTGAVFHAGSGAVTLRAPAEAPLLAGDGSLALEVPPAGRHLEVLPIARLEPALSALRPWLTTVGCSSAGLEERLLPLFDPVRVTRVGRMQQPPFDGPVDRRPSPLGERVGG